RLAANFVTAAVPLFFVMRTTIDPATGKIIPAWKYFWSLFGASNQLLAALALLGVTVWAIRGLKNKWIALISGVPMVFMYVACVYALFLLVKGSFFSKGFFALNADPVPWISVILIGLAVLMLVEAVRSLFMKSANDKPVSGAQPGL
ncbi:MAG TPA: carbon starvation CstA 5TM domain-containing protein, partial [bacterium]|nr:carbon starvation CstA 5TM domain-containing protein [bacterium]